MTYTEWLKNKLIFKQTFFRQYFNFKKIRLLAKQHKREDEAEESKVND